MFELNPDRLKLFCDGQWVEEGSWQVMRVKGQDNIWAASSELPHKKMILSIEGIVPSDVAFAGSIGYMGMPGKTLILRKGGGSISEYGYETSDNEIEYTILLLEEMLKLISLSGVVLK